MRQIDPFVLIRRLVFVIPPDMGVIEDLREFCLHRLTHREHRQGYFLGGEHTRGLLYFVEPIDILFVHAVKTLLVKNKEHDHDTGGHADGKTCDVDDRIGFVLPEITPGCFEIVFEHACRFEVFLSQLLCRFFGELLIN